MERFKQLFFKRLTVGFILSGLATFLFAILLRFLLESHFYFFPIKGGLT